MPKKYLGYGLVLCAGVDAFAAGLCFHFGRGFDGFLLVVVGASCAVIAAVEFNRG